jgi:hypothetical protein
MPAIVVSEYKHANETLRLTDLRQALYDEGAILMDKVLVNLHGDEHRARRSIEIKVFRRDFFEWYEKQVFPTTLRETLAPYLAAGKTDLVDFGMDLQEAGDAPRWRHIGGPDPGDGGSAESQVYLETGFGADVRAALAARGHKLVAGRYEDVGGYQAVARKDGVLYGASEMRKDGQAAGF